jgi:hypothetical protein
MARITRTTPPAPRPRKAAAHADLGSALRAITGEAEGSVSLVPVGDNIMQAGNMFVILIVIVCLWLIILKIHELI